MPNAVNNLRWEEWKVCDRCGFNHPISQLSKQLGLMLCQCHGCYDDLINMRRPFVIANIVKEASKEEFKCDWDDRLKDPGEVVFDGADQ